MSDFTHDTMFRTAVPSGLIFTWKWRVIAWEKHLMVGLVTATRFIAIRSLPHPADDTLTLSHT